MNKELRELLKKDILERYDNEEYWDKDIIDSYELETRFSDIVIPVYYSENDDGNIIIDEEAMLDEFESELLKKVSNKSKQTSLSA